MRHGIHGCSCSKKRTRGRSCERELQKEKGKREGRAKARLIRCSGEMLAELEELRRPVPHGLCGDEEARPQAVAERAQAEELGSDDQGLGRRMVVGCCDRRR